MHFYIYIYIIRNKKKKNKNATGNPGMARSARSRPERPPRPIASSPPRGRGGSCGGRTSGRGSAAKTWVDGAPREGGGGEGGNGCFQAWTCKLSIGNPLKTVVMIQVSNHLNKHMGMGQNKTTRNQTAC